MARHPEDKLLLQKEVITACATYTVLRQTLIFFLSTIVKLTQACLIIVDFHIHYQVFLKTALLGLNSRQYCLMNLQVKSCILTVATAGVIFTDPSESWSTG